MISKFYLALLIIVYAQHPTNRHGESAITMIVRVSPNRKCEKAKFLTKSLLAIPTDPSTKKNRFFAFSEKATMIVHGATSKLG